MTKSIAATYFDGRSTRGHPVTLSVSGGTALIAGEGVDLRLPLRALRVSEALGRGPRLITFPDGAHCEVRDHAGLADLLASSDRAPSLVERMQSSWGWVLIAILAIVAVFGAGYRWAVPWAAEIAAAQVPPGIVEKLSNDVLKSLDEKMMQPSKIAGARQDAILKTFADLRPPDGAATRYQIVFRASEIGANALALPSGLIIVTDDLVKLTSNDREIAAVLAHELGHVHEKHGLRQMLQASIVGVVLTWWLGDISSVIATVPAALLEAKFSRDFERAADDYAARMLRANGQSPALLAAMLEKLEAAHAGPRRSDDGKPGEPAPKDGAGTPARQSSPFDYMSSHPATPERLARLRAM